MGDYAKFVIVDSRQYVGNNLLFWRKGGGYTVHLDDAELFDEPAAKSIHKNRETDRPYRLSKIKEYATLQVDVERMNRDMRVD